MRKVEIFDKMVRENGPEKVTLEQRPKGREHDPQDELRGEWAGQREGGPQRPWGAALTSWRGRASSGRQWDTRARPIWIRESLSAPP